MMRRESRTLKINKIKSINNKNSRLAIVIEMASLLEATSFQLHYQDTN